jgi:hypothetical protein
MPFENTHLFLADKVLQSLQNEGLAGVLKGKLDYYYLGSIFPDTLFYAKDEKLSQVAYRLHGDDGRPTNRFALDVLDRIRESQSLQDFAFIAGFLTHCAADITFHPIVFYISGYMPNASEQAKQKSSFLHWQYETLIDERLNDRFRFEELVRTHLVRDLVAPDVLGVDADTIVRHLEKQRGYFLKIRSRFYYHVFRVLSRLGLVPPESVAGFYESLKTADIVLPERIPFCDVLSGEEMETSLEELADACVDLGGRLVGAAHDYFAGMISREQCEATLQGESLHTGVLGKTLRDVRHSADI